MKIFEFAFVRNDKMCLMLFRLMMALRISRIFDLAFDVFHA